MLTSLIELKGSVPTLVTDDNLADHKLPSELKIRLNAALGDSHYNFGDYTSYVSTDNGKYRPRNHAIIPNQYLLYASKIYNFAAEVYKYIHIYDRVKHLEKDLLGDANGIENKIKSKIEEEKKTGESKVTECFLNEDQSLNNDDIKLFSKFLDKNNGTYRLESKDQFDKDGKPRAPKDCFGSVISKVTNMPVVTSSVFGKLVYDLLEKPELYKYLVEFYEELTHGRSPITPEAIKGEYIRLSKPFLLLAGISGTGKTRFIREQAGANDSSSVNYCLTSVRPDWHEPSEVLGYVSRLSGNAEFVSTDVLRFIVNAWKSAVNAGLTVSASAQSGEENKLTVTGNKDSLDNVRPFWLCLDEMNLAPVEQYFADYLSVLETRRWHWYGSNFTYTSDALLKAFPISQITNKNKLRADLDISEPAYDKIWDLFCQCGIGIPLNLIVAGTVNMDETTHGFSRKVIDRALTFDFGEFFPNRYEEFFSPTSCNKRLSYPIWSQASKDNLADTIDKDGSKSVAFLSAVNNVLKSTPFELAYRALNELLLAVVSSQPKDELTLNAVWDDFMMCKVLPRIEGDTDKLTSTNGKNILAELNNVLATELAPILAAENIVDANPRPDLYREKVISEGATDEDKVLSIPCRSRLKLNWMSDRLKSATFTSFWP